MTNSSQTPYDALGEKKLSLLVDTFYDKVSKHSDLAPLFPTDLAETARKQKQFLTQFLGGPTLYTNEHGHPMLRARHMPFIITPIQAEAWLDCMKEAMDETQVNGPIREYMIERLTMTAHHMVNHP
ncbi:globin domain-containing protein [Halalkalibacter akibai]|uniref:Hemoglobin-like protein HbO n=1 Tax=Halalkalibacter akibai (strain ATCC 43226 / DSM 21942 / CIP 109018 / JCM 9157 / 1139) TaxID=1236973 RepID=W4QYA2_HALA3|nr:globin [Halalkalibacter akibai]GAE37061.1 hemoglobin-like protein HbO [Halalkalibacter akibai JCM 9157]